MLMWVSLVTILATGAVVHGRLPRDVRVAARETRVEYCDNDRDLATATIHVTLKFANRSKRNLILARKLGPGGDTTVTNEAGVVVYSPRTSHYETDLRELGPVPDNELFEIVAPGASAERDFTLWFPVSKNAARAVASAPPEGSYGASGTRMTWPFYGDEARASRMRDRWRRYGLLLIDPISVKGITVRITLPQGMRPCR